MMRYWDGTAWTGHTQPGPQPAPQPVLQPGPQQTFQPAPQPTFQPAPQQTFQPAPQQTFQPGPQQTFQPGPQQAFQPGPQPITPVAPMAAQGFDAIGGRVMTPGFGSTMTPGFGSRPGAPYAQEPFTRTPSKRSNRLGLWIAGAVGVLLVTTLLVVVILPKFAPISADYTGAPVMASDVASPGNKSVISASETVAVEYPAQWHDVQEYMDFEAAIGDLPAGATLVGAWFTRVPTSAASPPQMVMLMEFSPSAVGVGTMEDVRDRYVGGIKVTMPGIVVGPGQDYETALGLEGDRTDATYESAEENLTATMAIVAVAHGRRFVIAVWISYQGPIDEQGFESFMASLRVDA